MSEFSELLRRVREGDPAAAESLYAAYRSRVERVARRGIGARLVARYDTSDITQSVFGDMLRELPGFEDRGERAFRAWLLTKVRHKLASKARRESRRDGGARTERLDTRQGFVAVSSDTPPDVRALQRDDAERLTRLLGTLEPSQREVIGLFLDEGLPWEDVARRIGVPSAGAARMRYVRALALMRERWTRS